MEFKIYDTLPQEAREIRLRVFVREQGFQEEFDTADKFSTYIVAYDGDIPIATCRYYTQDSRFLIGRIAVIKQYRGKGIGANMLAFAMEKIRKVGGKEIGYTPKGAPKTSIKNKDLRLLEKLTLTRGASTCG